MGTLKLILDFLFPPFCIECHCRCETRYFCPSCWSLCAPLDPLSCCRHCFAPLEEEKELCPTCLHHPLLPIPQAFVFAPTAPIWRLQKEAAKALAGFAVYQWDRLHWGFFTRVIPFPDPASIEIGRAFASFFNCPLQKVLLQEGEEIVLKEKRLEPHQDLLLIGHRPSQELVQKAILALAQAFPKRMYLLRLFEDTF